MESTINAVHYGFRRKKTTIQQIDSKMNRVCLQKSVVAVYLHEYWMETSIILCWDVPTTDISIRTEEHG